MLDRDSTSHPQFTEGHALIVGVGEYQESHLNVLNIVADAEGVAAALLNPKVGAYPPNQVTVLTGPQATREAVIKALKKLASTTSDSSMVFLFLCSHGELGDDNDYYLITADTQLLPSGRVQRGTGLSASELVGLLRGISAHKLLCIINTCFSGYVGEHIGGVLSGQQPYPRAALPATLGPTLLASGHGRVLITSSRPSQYSHYQLQSQYTYFGQALIDGLYGKEIPDRGGYIGLYELYHHLYTQTRAATAQRGSQEPVLTVVEGVGPFPVALYPESRAFLNRSAIEERPPSNAAVELLAYTLVQALRNQQAQPVLPPPPALGAIAQGKIAGINIRQARLGLDFAAVLTGGTVLVGVLLVLRVLLAPLVPAIILSIYQVVFALMQAFVILVVLVFVISGAQSRRASGMLRELFGTFFWLARLLLLLPLTALAQLARLPLPHQSRIVTYTELLVDVGGGRSARAVITTDLPPSGINQGDYITVYGRRGLAGAVHANEIRVRSALTGSDIVVRRRGSWPWPVAIITSLVDVALALLPGVSAMPPVSSPSVQPNIAATHAPAVTSPTAQGSQPLAAATAQGSQPLTTGIPSVIATTPVRRARVANVGGVTLRVRREPSTNAAIAAKLAEHTLVELVGEPQTIGNTTWQQISYSGGMGWVDARYLLQEP